MITLPMIFFGFAGLSQRLNLQKPLVTAALVTDGFGTIAAMCAAVINGLVGPVLTRKIMESEKQAQTLLRLLLMNNSLLNQAFAKVYIVATAVAFIIWSIHLIKMGNFARVVAIIGFVIGALTLLTVFSGHLRLDVHGFGAVILAQSIWTILVGIFMVRWKA